MENTSALLKTSKLELLKALINKIKGFSPKETVEAMEKKLNGISKTKRGLLGLSLILIGGSLTIYSLNNAAQTSKTYWQELKASKSSKLSNKSEDDLLKLKSVSPNGELSSPKSQSNELTSSSKSSKIDWKPINYMLASKPERRAKALENIGLQSEGIIIALSLTCPECIKLAIDINSSLSKDKLSSIVGVAVAPGAEIKGWKEKLNLDYEVKSISETDMEDIGVVLFPSLIKVSNTSKNHNKPKFEVVASSDDSRVLINTIDNLNPITNITNASNVSSFNPNNNKK